MDDLWKSVLAEIEVDVGKPTYLTYFKNTRLITIDNDIANISTSSSIIAEFIEERYYSLIKNILDKKTGRNMSLIFKPGIVASTSQSLKSTATISSPGPLFARDVLVPAKKRPSRIKTDYTFDTFAVSETNQLAYTAALTVAQDPGSKYNPVFLYGTVGVGKTHLMHSIANKIYEKNSSVSVLYLTTEEFTNEVVESIRDKSTTAMRKKFRNVDLLLLDDIQFLSGKDKVQEELFHTFNTLIENNKQVIFTSDRPPAEIPKIEARLASRFEGGLSVDIEPPDFELRTAILLMKSKKYDMDLTLEMAKLAAERITDTRALEGFLLRLASLINVKGDTPSKNTILSLLGKVRATTNVFKPDTIVDAICEFYDIKPTQLKGSKRDAALVRARHVCMYLLKEDGKLTFVEVGNLLGGRDHTTVMHAVEKISSLLSEEDHVQEELVSIKRRIQEEVMQ